METENKLEIEVARMDARLANVERNLDDLRSDVRQLRTETLTKFRTMRAEAKTDLRTMLGWLGGFMVVTLGGFGTTIGVVGRGFKWW